MQLKQAINLVRQMGPAWVAGRAGYSLRRKSGWLERRCPASDWAAYSLAGVAPENLRETLAEIAAQRFFIGPEKRLSYQKRLRELITPEAEQQIHDEIAALKRGETQFFSSVWRETGWPVRWHRHPETGEGWPRDAHWSKIADLGGSDVKWLWEIGRFGVTYTLLRAYWLTGDASRAETFWQMAESWREQNPPNQGAHWMCGQEAAFRVLAWLFGLFGFLDAPATTEARLVSMLEMLHAHGTRIAGNIGYALAQKNNHGINEALGLWLLGMLFPFLPHAAQWERDGRKLLETEGLRQIYEDGSYVQQSVNYHRLILQSYAVALRLGDKCGRPFSAQLKERCARAADWLWQITDAQSGAAPNYGSNDGAILFRLDSADFTDYRAASGFADILSAPPAGGAKLAPNNAPATAREVSDAKTDAPGGSFADKMSANPEAALWLGADPAPMPPQRNLAAEAGGYYTIRGAQTWAFTRCGVYRDRPAQADMLHADIWWRGHNLVADPGTYSYNSPAPWTNGLATTRVHNAVALDGLDQMERGPRFTWFYWTRGRKIRHEENLFIGEHYGYQARLGVTHRRAILLQDNWLWVIVDDLQGAGIRDLAAQWLFPEAEILTQEVGAFHLHTPVGECRVWFAAFAPETATNIDVVQGSPDDTLGWFAPRYLDKRPALGLIARDRCALPARRVTVIALDAAARLEILQTQELIVIRGEDETILDLNELA
jgi:hypothetical protein